MYADGTGSSFVDSSPYPHTLAASGATQSTTNGRSSWGNSSAYINGSGYRVTTADRGEFWLSNLDYVVEAWLYITTLNTQGGGYFVSQMNNVADNSNRQFGFAANSNGLLAYWTTNGVSDQTATFSTSLPVAQWFHVAFVRSSNVLRAYVNGSQVGASVSHTVTYYDSTADLCVGTFGKYAANGYGYLDFNGYIDDLRITRGTNRGITGSTFTSPASSFPSTGTLETQKLSVARSNGTSTFLGNGVFCSPFDRMGIYVSDNADSLTNYTFTATESCTAYISFAWYDPDDSGPTVTVNKKATASSSSTAVATYTSQGKQSLSVSLVAGNVLLFSTDTNPTEFGSVLIYAA